MTMRFVHEIQPQRVCFGSGEAAATLAGEITRLGASRVMVRASSPSCGPLRNFTVTVPPICVSGKLGQVLRSLRSPAMTAWARVPWYSSISCAYSPVLWLM